MRRRHFLGPVVLVMLIVALLSSSFHVTKVEAEPQVTIVSSNIRINPDNGQYCIFGEVLNSGDTALERMFPTAIFYDSDGTVVGTGSGMSLLENLLPGRKAPFIITLREVPPLELDHYSLNVSAIPTAPRPIGLEILSHRSYIDETARAQTLYVTGELMNIGDTGVWSIHITATFYDETGNVVAIDTGVAHARSVVHPGEKFQFTKVTWGEHVEEIASYTVTTECIFYEVKEEKGGIVDRTHPIVTILSPTNTTYQTDPQLHFNVNEPTSWMGYSLDGQENVTLTENTFNLTGLSNGSHNLTVFARDTGGNTGTSETIYFTVDSIPPVISILSPENKTYYGSQISLNFTVSESTSWMCYSLDGQNNVTLTETTLNLTGLVDGSHNLTVYAEGETGKVGKSETVHFTIESGLAPWTIAITIITAVAVASILIYYEKIRKQKQ